MLRLKARIRKWKAERKLKKSGYLTWRNYKHNRDPDVAQYADYIDDFYHGYPYVFACPNPKHYAYTCIYDYGPGGHRYGYHEMSDWCSDNCRFHSCIRAPAWRLRRASVQTSKGIFSTCTTRCLVISPVVCHFRRKT